MITFLIDHEKMTYIEAVEYLAKNAGMPLPQEESDYARKNRIMREKALAALKLAARFYFDNLYKPEGKLAIEYINQRGLSDKTVKTFGIGYSTDFYALPRYMQNAGYDPETLLAAGLVSRVEGGRIIDFQGGRLIIPIINPKGQVIAFGGRSLDKNKHPKYKNTSATVLFDKKSNLYNLNIIKKLDAKARADSLILVEGYMDVIALSEAGIDNAIAAMGTALTNEQCKEISKFAKLVYVSFDGDAAGQAAALRSLDMLVTAGLEVRVVSMPDGMDPDDIVKKVGKEGYLDLVTNALPLIDYKLKKLSDKFNLNTSDGKSKYAKAAVAILAALDPILQDTYIKQVSEVCAVSESTIKNSIKTFKIPTAPVITKKEVETEKPVVTAPPEMRASIVAARFVLSSYFAGGDYVFLDDIKDEYFEYPPHRKVYEYITERINTKQRFIKGDLFDILSDTSEEARKILTAADLLPEDKRAEYYAESLALLDRNAREKRKLEIITALNTTEDGEQKNLLQEELRKLMAKDKKSK